ncbi:MAG TPA: SRPBCC family protein [Capsulimonadaceae bacterium]|nr:SRPBCC family protein [Capsulimonadaceae bacterium]
MSKPTFVYVTYINTTPEKLWEALTSPDFTQKYWGGVRQESDWKVGSPWRLVMPSGEVWDTGEVLEVDPPRRYVVSWRHEHFDDLRDVGETQQSVDVEPWEGYLKLTITHEAPEGGEKFIEAVSGGWPAILASLKTMLETGKALPGSDRMPDQSHN